MRRRKLTESLVPSSTEEQGHIFSHQLEEQEWRDRFISLKLTMYMPTCGLSGNISQCMLRSWTQDLCPWPSKGNTEPTVSNITGKTKQMRVGRVCSYQMRPDHPVISLTLAGNKTRVGESRFQTVRLDVTPLEGLWSPLPLICLPLR